MGSGLQAQVPATMEGREFLVRVKVLEVDRQGRVRLSMRNVDAA